MEQRNDELMHYGRKGMKWGEHIYRKEYPVSETRRQVDSAKQEYKTAKKNYKTADKNYKDAKAEYGKRYAKTNFDSPKKESRKEYESAKARYESAKAKRETEIESTAKQISMDNYVNVKESKGVAKYMVDNNMSIEEAQKIYRTERNRNIVIGALAAVGAYIVI